MQPMLGWQAALAHWPYSQDELDSEEFQLTDKQSSVVRKALQVGLPCSTSPACQLLLQGGTPPPTQVQLLLLAGGEPFLKAE